MHRSRTQLSDGALIAQAHTHYKQGLTSTAELLADLAEIEARRIHVAMGYPSMRAWCIGELKMTDAAILDRIQAARTAREHPAIFPMLADGRLNLTSVLILSPYLTTGNADELLAGAAEKTKSQLGEWMAGRFPTSESLPMVMAGRAIEESSAATEVATHGRCANSVVPERANWHMHSGQIAPVASGRHRVEFMVSDAERELLRQVLDLRASHDLSATFLEGLALLKAKLEKRKCAKTERPPRAPRARRPGGRLVPDAVRREVWKRDGHQCAFVGENGRRCEARRGLECDHMIPVARGGESSVSNVRLLCRAHNQFEADRVLGRAFMEGKRARETRVSLQTEDESATPSQAAAPVRVLAVTEDETCANAEPQPLARAVEHEQLLDVMAAIESLGIRTERARWATETSRAPGSTLEQHVRAALKLLKPRLATTTRSASARSAALA